MTKRWSPPPPISEAEGYDEALRQAAYRICRFANGSCECKKNERQLMCADVNRVAATVLNLGAGVARDQVGRA